MMVGEQHFKRKLLCAAVAVSVTLWPAANVCAQSADRQLESRLRTLDESLLSAVHRGERQTWEAVTTLDFMYVEDGEISPRAAFLEGLKEDGLLPLIIESYSLQRIGDTAIVMHTDRLSPRANSDVSRSRFLFLETWQQIAGSWKLRLIHIDRLRVDPVAVQLTAKQSQSLIGTYRSGSDVYRITRDGGGLAGFHADGRREELRAETPDVLFTPGYFRLRKLFRFGADGRVVGFVDRSVAMDRFWKKMEAATKP